MEVPISFRRNIVDFYWAECRAPLCRGKSEKQISTSESAGSVLPCRPRSSCWSDRPRKANRPVMASAAARAAAALLSNSRYSDASASTVAGKAAAGLSRRADLWRAPVRDPAWACLSALSGLKKGPPEDDPFEHSQEEPPRSGLGSRIVVMPAGRPPDVRLFGITP